MIARQLRALRRRLEDWPNAVVANAYFPTGMAANGVGAAVAKSLIGEGRVGAAKLDDAIGAEVKSADGLRVYVLKLYG